jgi:hypothetical protein
MILFVDESGDPGLKLKRGSSKYLIIAGVIFREVEEIRKATREIERFRQKFQYSSTYEFKFNKTKKRTKIGFLKSVKDCNFEIRSVVLDKSILSSSFRKQIEKNLYDICFKVLLEDSVKDEKEVKVRLDGSAGREFRKTVTVSLRRFLNENKKGGIKLDLKVVDSKGDVIIQLADMVVGSIRRGYSKSKGDSNLYKGIIKEKIISEKTLKQSDLVSILE